MSNARLDDKGRLLTGPCACGEAQAPFGWGGDLAADPPRLGTWRCGKCNADWLAAQLGVAAPLIPEPRSLIPGA